MDNNKQAVPGPQPTPGDKINELVEKFKELPKNAQIAVAGFAFVFVIILFGGEDPQPQQQAAQVSEGDALIKKSASRQSSDGAADGFEATGPSRESLQRGFYTQQRKELAELKSTLMGNVEQELSSVNEIKDAVMIQQQQMQQMIDTFNAQIRSFETANTAQREEIARLVEEARQQRGQEERGQVGIGGESTVEAARKRAPRISQTSLGGGGSGIAANPDQALLGFAGGVRTNSRGGVDPISYVEKKAEPFLPPLGFVKGTLLNGFDALVGGSVPALVRLSGVYKTAMNSTVSLDGCFMMVEFEGEISTERAIGKPSRLTCVYPDRGAVTYELSGYVVDANDGIVGVPGVFYEGDASRIAAALMADFAAGMANVVSENEFTEETSEGGTARNLTGSALKAEVGAGVSDMMASLRDYLATRSSRVVPFVRIDSTRDIHVVILSGIELRDEGSAWTELREGQKADQYRDENEAARREAEKARQKQEK